MLFSTATYSERRSRLRQLVGSGVIVLLGNNDSPCNFPNNPYKFRQDSSFLYFTGQHRDGLALVIDCESGAETLVGNDIDIDDVIWTGPVPSVADMAAESGITHTAPMGALQSVLEKAKAQGEKAPAAKSSNAQGGNQSAVEKGGKSEQSQTKQDDSFWGKIDKELGEIDG